MKSKTRRLQLVLVFMALSCFVIYAYRGSESRRRTAATSNPAAEAQKPATPKTAPVAVPMAPAGGTFDITSSIIANGGGDTSGGTLSLTSTIGQPVVGTSTGGTF